MEEWEKEMRVKLLHGSKLISEEYKFIQEMNRNKINSDELLDSYLNIIDQVEFMNHAIKEIK